MRTVTKDIQLTIDGSPLGFSLTKLDAFSGVMLLRLLMRLETERRASRRPPPVADEGRRDVECFRRSEQEQENCPCRSKKCTGDPVL